jgi:hypothetical protein
MGWFNTKTVNEGETNRLLPGTIVNFYIGNVLNKGYIGPQPVINENLYTVIHSPPYLNKQPEIMSIVSIDMFVGQRLTPVYSDYKTGDHVLFFRSDKTPAVGIIDSVNNDKYGYKKYLIKYILYPKLNKDLYGWQICCKLDGSKLELLEMSPDELLDIAKTNCGYTPDDSLQAGGKSHKTKRRRRHKKSIRRHLHKKSIRRRKY